MPELQRSIDKQLKGTPPPLGSIKVVELEWGEEAFARSPLSRPDCEPFDVIILAELVYNTNYHDLLLWTICKFSHPGIVSAALPFTTNE